MKIEIVRIEKTLKSGKTVWEQGTILPEQRGDKIPLVILEEARLETGTVKILKQGRDITSKPVLVQKDEKATTTTTMVEKKEKPKLKLKPKSKLVKRKKK